MGGSALKNTTTRRYLAAEYRELAQEVWETLEQMFPYSRVNIIKAYRNKDSFGDMDVLLCSENLPSNWIDEVKEHFTPNETVKNGNCLSFDCKELQIDIIVAKPEEYLSSLQYLSFNDLGNLTSRIAHSIGLKLGHDGLSYNFREGTNNYRNVVLTRDWKVVCDVLMLSYKTFKDGFDNLEDIFKFVVSSPFFNKTIFALENRNHAARTRDQKRSTYTAFLKWIENDNNLEEDNYYFPKVEDKSRWLPRLFRLIPDFETTYHQVMSEWNLDKKFKLRYNGEIVSGLIGLKDKELGKFMKWTKDRYPDNKLNTIVNTMNVECIDDFILHNYAVYTDTLKIGKLDNLAFKEEL